MPADRARTSVPIVTMLSRRFFPRIFLLLFAAYAVVPGKSWDDYNCEQQATIIERWYGNGLSTTDPLYPFIRDHIRPGKN